MTLAEARHRDAVLASIHRPGRVSVLLVDARRAWNDAIIRRANDRGDLYRILMGWPRPTEANLKRSKGYREPWWYGPESD